MGDNSKPDTRKLLPNVDDIVLYKTEKSKKFGVIVEVIGNICSVKTHHYGVITVLEKHCRVLTLLFRASEWDKHGIPAETQASNPKNAPAEGGCSNALNGQGIAQMAA